MATLPELKSCCDFFEIDYSEMDRTEMKKEIIDRADKKFARKKLFVAADLIPKYILKFLVEECNYKIIDKDKNELDFTLRRKDG